MGNKIKKAKPIFNFARKVFIILGIDFLLKKLLIGREMNSLIGKMIPNNYQYKKNTFRKFNYNGVWLKVDIRDYVGHFLYFGFRDIAQEKLLKLCKSGDFVLDIGTNIGSTLLQIANKVGKNGYVFGFEPDPLNFKNCLANIKLNNFENINVSNIGFGDENGEFDLVVDTETNRGGNRISFDNKIGGEKTKIKVEKLDNWVENNKVNKIDLIKIDVEGFELKVLKGGIRILEKFEPKLFIEIDDNNLKAVGDTAKCLFTFLEEINYSSFNAVTEEIIDSNYDFSNCHFDIIAEKKWMG